MSQRNATYSPQAHKELFQDWIAKDVKTARKIGELVSECLKTPFEGKGKPEPLRGDLAGYWSRRINDKDRLIYRVSEEEIYILSCIGHYGDK